jgi:hypothetical protein
LDSARGGSILFGVVVVVVAAALAEVLAAGMVNWEQSVMSCMPLRHQMV